MLIVEAAQLTNEETPQMPVTEATWISEAKANWVGAAAMLEPKAVSEMRNSVLTTTDG